ncbi:hypothetical protein CkaCkLH20_04286 [Colletotrichum karsti]|uniref:Orotidine 5'-phosphate decarboxylase n=1 Tax=Colletotrichum karsti TaxID=1095194 RepID=A0A9P6LLX1_9PEZI|nr:uncharacterized protein CkaCkLH20_04286 [Colletotrichum karsti]KAF9878248.1 hypothetical protein CkaCkLH20_04286 [Colletotrichum karsti]
MYAIRAQKHQHPVARQLLEIAERKQSNLIISADFTTTNELLKCADDLGPYIAVFKTHIDMVSDFSNKTVEGLIELKRKHDFLIFEDRKLIDIGNTAKQQYHGGALRISEWADVVNVSILGGKGILDALNQVLTNPGFAYREKRALLILAEMTSEGSLATGEYTQRCLELAGQYPESIIGFVATKALSSDASHIVFTTGVNMSDSGDSLGQQYQTPTAAILGGSDFIIVGRGILNAQDSVGQAQRYRKEGWEAYLKRTGS